MIVQLILNVINSFRNHKSQSISTRNIKRALYELWIKRLFEKKHCKTTEFEHSNNITNQFCENCDFRNSRYVWTFFYIRTLITKLISHINKYRSRNDSHSIFFLVFFLFFIIIFRQQIDIILLSLTIHFLWIAKSQTSWIQMNFESIFIHFHLHIMK